MTRDPVYNNQTLGAKKLKNLKSFESRAPWQLINTRSFSNCALKININLDRASAC